MTSSLSRSVLASFELEPFSHATALDGYPVTTYLKIFASFDFLVAGQRGIHVKLRRILSDGTRQTLSVPDHEELDIGTLKAIFRQWLRYISDAALQLHF